jgi:CHAD domain-containing protein
MSDLGLAGRTLRFTLERGERVPDLGSHGFRVVAPPTPPSLFETTYHDTADLRLARWGSTLTYRAGEGWTVELPDPDGEPRAVGRLLGDDGDDMPRDALNLTRSLSRGAPIRPVAALRSSRRSSRLIDSGGVLMAELHEDAVIVRRDAGPASGFRELEVQFAVGGERADELAEILRRGAAEAPATRLARVLGPRAIEPADVPPRTVEDDATAAELLMSELSAAVRRFMLHAPLAVEGVDPEGVHQARVAVRRFRSYLQGFRPILVEEWSEPLRADLTMLADVFGEVRDADVLIERLSGMGNQLPAEDVPMVDKIVLRRLGDRHVARARLLHFLEQPEYLELLDRMVDAALNPRLLDNSGDLARTVLQPMVAKRWRKLRNAVRALDDPPADEQLHAVRLQAKRTRYAAEAMEPLAGKDAASFAAAAAALQEVLGAHQDAVVGQRWLRDEFRSGDPDLSFVVGELAGLEQTTSARTRADWTAAWDRVRKRSRWLK